eukprot:14102226-Alexandrium_andersonii.AAC.1
MDPSCDGDYDAQALVAPWPVAAPSDTCGCMMRRCLEDWARAQALWLGHSAIAARAPGTVALAVASPWV